MLPSRLYTPTDNELLYHYCGTASFLSIVGSGQMRFSDINMMNDGAEVRWGYSKFEEAATVLIKTAKDKPDFEALDVEFFQKVDKIVGSKQLLMQSLIACFSKSPDVLSQWRAYGADGQGLGIGFAATALKAMPVALVEVLYDPDAQLNEMKVALAAIYLGTLQSREPFGAEFRENCQLLSVLMAAFKHPSFKEEQEVRALHEVVVKITEHAMWLEDAGGIASGEEVSGGEVKFDARGADVVAYLDIPFGRSGSTSIKEVWLGPRNRNGPGNILFPIGKAGHRGVSVMNSRSPYR